MEVFQVVGVDQVGGGAPVAVGGRQPGEVAQAGSAAAVWPVLVLADPVFGQRGAGVGGVVTLRQFPLWQPRAYRQATRGRRLNRRVISAAI